jgi:integral membrane protein
VLQSAIGRLRITGIAEGISLLLLLFVAMPLKYYGGQPQMVTVVGWIHGILFVLFMLAVMIVYRQHKWPFARVIIAFLAAFLPFGTFIFDSQLKKEQKNSIRVK